MPTTPWEHIWGEKRGDAPERGTEVIVFNRGNAHCKNIAPDQASNLHHLNYLYILIRKLTQQLQGFVWNSHISRLLSLHPPFFPRSSQHKFFLGWEYIKNANTCLEISFWGPTCFNVSTWFCRSVNKNDKDVFKSDVTAKIDVQLGLQAYPLLSNR